jgi:hypothetical protein
MINLIIRLHKWGKEEPSVKWLPNTWSGWFVVYVVLYGMTFTISNLLNH